MYGTDDNMVSNSRSLGGSVFSSIWRSRTSLAREQSLARFNDVYGIADLRKDYQCSKRKLKHESSVVRKDRSVQEGAMMFRRKKLEQEKLNDKLVVKLDEAADTAVKEAKKTQEIIIANGFTLELLTAMSGGA